MKKSILIFGSLLLAISLMSVGYVNWNKEVVKTSEKKQSIQNPLNPFAGQQLFMTMVKPNEFVYNIDSRFLTTITKEQLHTAKSINDILPKEATQSVDSYKNVKVAIIQGDDETIAKGMDEMLNPTQLELLQSTDYSTDIYVYANYNLKSEVSGVSIPRNLTYYITIIPEKEAVFANGNEAMIDYLKENSKAETANIYYDQVKPGRIKFTVTKEGNLTNARLTSTCGYPMLDEKMEKLINTLPGKWNPATNSKGEKVAQELIFFFGAMGC